VEWQEFPALFDLLPWQQPGCLASRTWPIAPMASTLRARWDAFVAIDDTEQRAEAFRTAKTGRNIHTKVPGMAKLSELGPDTDPEPIVRYGYRSFDRQWILEDPRLLKTEAPTLWAVRGNEQVFMATSAGVVGGGPGASAFTCVPDYHAFRGSYGGKDIIPLYRDSSGTANVDQALLTRVTELHRDADPEASPVNGVDLFAYCYAVLAGGDYTVRFAEELETPGPRIPLTADPQLFSEMVAFGRYLLWLQTYGERFAASQPGEIRHESVKLNVPISTLPNTAKDNRYEPGSGVLHVADGQISGVSESVWEFAVSGMPVVKKWLGYRTARASGRAASSSSPLDHIRPDCWPAEWTEELLDLLSVLQRTVDALAAGTELLDRICDGPLIGAAEVPAPPQGLREPPVFTAAGQADLGI
jgi:hypothetical protein